MSPKSTRLALGLLFSLFLAQPVLKSQDVILQGFYWNTNPGDISTNSGVWWDTIAGIAPYLQNTGFETVWTPPANKGFGNVYDMGYGVYDYYDFGQYNQKGSTRTRHGNKAQLQNMISALHSKGIKVMADLVLNHRGGGDALEPEDCNDGVNPTDAWTDFNPASGRLPMDAADFHPNFTHCDVFAPYHDRLFFEDLCYFNFLDQTLDPPLNDWYFGPHNLGRAGDSLIVWGRYLLDDIGFDEVRLDAVKHIEPGFLAPFLVELAAPDQPFAVGELFDGNLGTLVNYRNEVENFVSDYGIGAKDANLAIFDFNLRYALRDMCNGGGGFNMWNLNTSGLLFGGGLPGEDVVTFVENHDVDRIGWQVVNCSQPHQQQVGSTCLALSIDSGHDPVVSDKEDMGYPYIMAAEGRPTVFWKDLFWYGLKEDIEWQMALREATATGGSGRIQDLNPFFTAGNGGDLFVMNRYGTTNGASDGLVLALNDNPSSESSAWVNTPFSNKYLKDYSDGYLFVTTQAFADSRANVKAQSRDYAWWSVTGLYPQLPGATGSNFQMDAEPGGCPHFIALRAADAANLLVNGAPIAAGDEVAVKNGDGDIVGIGRIGQGFQWDGQHDMIIEVLGAPSTNGMGNGEQFSFVVYDASANAEVMIGYVQYATAGSGFTFSPDRPDSPNRNGNFSTFNLTATATGLYTCGGITQVLAFGLPVVPLEEQCGLTSRADAGAYNDGLQNGDNDGSRFGAWTSIIVPGDPSQGGIFIGASTGNNAGGGDSNGDGDINTGGEAWGFYHNISNGIAEATRPFVSPLTPGSVFSISMDNGGVDGTNGAVGFGLRNGGDQNLMEFYFRQGQGNYKISDNGSSEFDTGIPFNREGFKLEVLLLSSSTYTLTVTRLVDGQVFTFPNRNLNNPGGGQAINRVRLFNYNAGNGSERNVYFNSLRICDPPALVINEVDYDQPGADNAEFIELRNMNTTTLNLDDFSLQLINGVGNVVYETFNLPNVNVAAGDYYVVCLGGYAGPECDLTYAAAIQNGAPDAVRLVWNGVTVDALSYEGDVAGAVEGSGVGLLDPDTTPGLGLSRVPDGADTDQNNVDFELTCITPGAANAPDNTDTDNDGAPDGCDDCPLAQNEGSIPNFDIGNCACDPGYFAVTTIINGQVVITGCQECPPGTFCPDGINSYPCQTGSFQSLAGQTECVDCPAGRFQPNMGAVFCFDCPAGKYQDQPGATACLDCQPGTYQSAVGSVSCINCPAGEYQNQPGQTECLECLPGTYQSAVGSVSCINCPPGKFSAVFGAEECDNCQQGTYQPNSGASDCINCPVGTYNDLIAQTNCQTCEPGTEAPFSGSALCQNCTPPSFSICPAVTPVDAGPGECEAMVTVPTPELSGLCTRNHALDFDGVNDYVALPSLYNPATTSFTVEAWINPGSVSGVSHTIVQQAGANGRTYLGIGSADKFYTFMGGSALSGTTTAIPNTWYHVAVTFDGTTLRLYVNGMLEASENRTMESESAGFLLGILKDLASGHFDGSIDEVRFWNYARNQSQLQAAKDLEINPTYPGLIAFYNFNEGIACCNNTGLATLPDGMPSASNGTLNNFSLASGCTSNWVAGAPALGDPLTLTNDLTADCGDASGTFSVGNTIVTWTATGANGQTATCEQTVMVNDNQPPTITCPSNITVTNDPGVCTANVTVPTPVTDDNCAGNGLDFDGINDLVDLGALNFYGNSFTVEGWFKSQDASGGATLFTTLNANGSAIDVQQTGASLRFVVRNPPANSGGVAIFGATAVFDGNWHHFAAVKGDDNRLRLYIDGVLQATSTSAIGDFGPNTYTTYLGYHSAGSPRYFDGVMDDIRFWNVARTGTEVVNNMNAELDGTEPGLFAYYKLNEGASCGNNTGLTTAFDETVNGNHGTLTSFDLTGSLADPCQSNWANGLPGLSVSLANDFNNQPTLTDDFPLGTTTVIWTATDPSGNPNTCSMTVTVNDTEPPTALCKNITVNLTAPGTYTLTAAEIDDNSTDNCTVSLSIPPTVFDCEDVGLTFPVLLTVSDGVNTDDCTAQVTVADGNSACNQPPTAVCQPVAVNANANCQGIAAAQDFDGGSTDPDMDPLSFSVSPSGPYPLGVTPVTLTVTDDDGATDDCNTTITVQDATPPSITCPASATVSPAPGSCEYTISGTAYDPTGISDNCGIGGPASYSVVSGSVSPAMGSTLAGAVLAVGANVIEWSVTDVNSQTGTCQFTLTVSPCTISGKLIWKGPPANTTTGVANATVFLSGDDSDTFTPTLANGEYSFTGFTGSNFTIKPQKTSGMFNGVNVGDATAIQVHLTGPPYVTDFFRLVAADVNKSNTISTLDATLIKQALLGNPTAINILNNTKSWRFISSSFVYPNPAGPFTLPAGMPETRSVTGQATGQDFFGIKVGDFLETANPALRPMQMEPLVWRTADRKLQAGETLEITFTTSNFEDIAAYQFALDFDPAALAFQSLEVLTDLIPLTLEGNFGLFNIESGELRTLFSMLPGQTIPTEHPVFRLNFSVLESGQMLSEVLQISQDAISALAFNTVLDETAVELEFYQETTSVLETPTGERKVVLLQNRPNPFDRETTIGFILPEACESQLRVFDLNGRELWKTSKQYGAGYQEEIVNLEHAGAAGLLFCELATPFGVVVGKMAMTVN